VLAAGRGDALWAAGLLLAFSQVGLAALIPRKACLEVSLLQRAQRVGGVRKRRLAWAEDFGGDGAGSRVCRGGTCQDTTFRSLAASKKAMKVASAAQCSFEFLPQPRRQMWYLSTLKLKPALKQTRADSTITATRHHVGGYAWDLGCSWDHGQAAVVGWNESTALLDTAHNIRARTAGLHMIECGSVSATSDPRGAGARVQDPGGGAACPGRHRGACLGGCRVVMMLGPSTRRQAWLCREGTLTWRRCQCLCA
jgi:hypothetical protein